MTDALSLTDRNQLTFRIDGNSGRASLNTTDADRWSAPWLPASVAAEQGASARIALDDWLAGKPHVLFDALKKLVVPIFGKQVVFLEVGCGAGYNLEVLRSINHRVWYTGIDISPAMVSYARKQYCGRDLLPDDCLMPLFFEGSAERLEFTDGEAECVMLAAVIQHCPDWRKAVSEAVRVSSRWIILHRIMCTTLPTREYTIRGYGQTLPIRESNQPELMDYCFSLGLKLIDEVKWDIEPIGRQRRWQGSYLLEKST